jgi:hypothetical protein
LSQKNREGKFRTFIVILFNALNIVESVVIINLEYDLGLSPNIREIKIFTFRRKQVHGQMIVLKMLQQN